jgi:hypothetical protein
VRAKSSGSSGWERPSCKSARKRSGRTRSFDGDEGPRRERVLRLVTPLDRTSPRVMRLETAASLRMRQTAPGTLSWSSRSARN